ncbi:MAG: hypothetical protein ACTSXJ_05660 [Candidatus Baldrarchaeia archaeon]
MGNAVIDATSLIYLAKSSNKDLLRLLFGKILVPPAVYEEVVVRGKEIGARDALLVERNIKEGVLEVVAIDDDKVKSVENMLPTKLSAGEREAIAIAATRNLPIILDDLAAVRVCMDLDLETLTSEIVLITALIEGLISAREFEERLSRLLNYKRVRTDVLLLILKIHEMWVRKFGKEGGT